MTNILKTKYNYYLTQLPSVQDNHGWVDFHCDGLAFNSLLGCVPEIPVNIYRAFDSKTGMWLRRAVDNPCFDCNNKTDVGSKSTISRDMLLMLLYYLYYRGDLKSIEQIIKYALSNYLIMGDAINLKEKIGRTLLSPALLATYAWASYRLGGPSRPWLRWIPVNPVINTTDYQAHLAVLHALLRDELTKETPEKHKKLYEYQVNRNPENGLFQYAAGNIDKVYTILNNEQYFPADRLPNELDRKSPWLWERDLGDNYKPGSENKTHSAGDYLFLFWLITK